MTFARKKTTGLPCAPAPDCPLCDRLVTYRNQNRITYPEKHNGAVPSFGPEDAELLVVGLAPGLKGANFSGRPFTGDYAGDLLYKTLLAFGFARGRYDARADDGLDLINCRITNAVRCVPPENKPLPSEMTNCLPFLKDEISGMPRLKTLVALGLIAHNAVLKTLNLKQSKYKFSHGALHALPNGLTLVDSYHCSRYNTNTGRLTEEMFMDVFKAVTDILKIP